MKILCDKVQINLKLDGRKIPWLVERLNEYGILIEYKALVQLLNNRSDWKLIYAVGVCHVFNCKIGDLFYILDNNGDRTDIGFL